MTTVGLVDSIKYGGRMFLYVLGVVVLGFGGMALGGALAGPEIQSGTFEALPLAGGLVIGLLGVVIWFVGMYALTYKFIADAVSMGVRTSEVEPSADELPADEESVAADSRDPRPSPAGATAARPREGGSPERHEPRYPTDRVTQEPAPRDQPTGGTPGGEPVDEATPAGASTRESGGPAAESTGRNDGFETETADGPRGTGTGGRRSGGTPEADPEGLDPNAPGAGAGSGREKRSEVGPVGDDITPGRETRGDGVSSERKRERTAEEIAFGRSSNEPSGRDRSAKDRRSGDDDRLVDEGRPTVESEEPESSAVEPGSIVEPEASTVEPDRTIEADRSWDEPVDESIDDSPAGVASDNSSDSSDEDSTDEYSAPDPDEFEPLPDENDSGGSKDFSDDPLAD